MDATIRPPGSGHHLGKEVPMRILAILASLILLLNSASLADESYAFGVGPQMGVPLQSGTFKSHTTWGAGVHAHFRYLPRDEWSISGSTGYVTWSRDKVMGDSTTTVREYDTIPILLGFQYYRHLKRDIYWYVSGEAGFRFYNINVKEHDLDGALIGQENASETKTSIAPGVGLMYRVSDYVYVDAGLRLEYVGTNLSYVSLALVVGYRPFSEY